MAPAEPLSKGYLRRGSRYVARSVAGCSRRGSEEMIEIDAIGAEADDITESLLRAYLILLSKLLGRVFTFIHSASPSLRKFLPVEWVPLNSLPSMCREQACGQSLP